MCVRVCVFPFVCMFVCLYACMYVCMFVFVRVCVRERGRESECVFVCRHAGGALVGCTFLYPKQINKNK